jgi:hypothetical protein
MYRNIVGTQDTFKNQGVTHDFFSLPSDRGRNLLPEDEYQDFVGRLKLVWLMREDTKADDGF